jgi:hypothetical protein
MTQENKVGTTESGRVESGDACPTRDGSDLDALATAALIDRMRHGEDRVTREVIDGCARRGDEMTQALRDVVLRPRSHNDSSGDWWLRLHAVMILGLIPTAAAGDLLVEAMRDMDRAGDDNLQDWLSGDWPAFFANKPEAVLPAAKSLAEDRIHDWYIRGNAVDVVVAAAEREGAAALDEALAWVASIAADESEDRDMRLTMGSLLLDLPRPVYRSLVEGLASGEPRFGARFSARDIESAYRKGEDPEWRRRENPWAFYEPRAIARRQKRWAEEDAARARAAARARRGIVGTKSETPVRAGPKVGRNDPCPCGSGKKYKKCCLPDLT